MKLAESAENEERITGHTSVMNVSATKPATAGRTATHVDAAVASDDPRWLTIEQILQSEAFQKSTRLSDLLRYLAVQTLAKHKGRLTEQAIGRAVLGKSADYTPAEDSAVRVYVRQLRLRLHEFYDGPGRHEPLIVTLPKGGYALSFQDRALEQPLQPEPVTPTVAPAPALIAAAPSQRSLHRTYLLLLALALAVGIAGWYRALTVAQATIPWPLSNVVHPERPTQVVLADAGFVLRMLGDEEVPLDRYISRSYLPALLPKNMTANEASVLQYISNSRLTSIADAHAVAALTFLTGPSAQNLVIRSARDLNANDLSSGDLIFVGSHTSNPWVSVYEQSMNFQIREDTPHSLRYVVNHQPLAGEQNTYTTSAMGTLASGDDYAVIACLPARRSGDNVLVIEGVRMEGSEAAISLLQNKTKRSELEQRLSALNGGHAPLHFEALLHAQSVAGVNVAVDVVAVRVLP